LQNPIHLIVLDNRIVQVGLPPVKSSVWGSSLSEAARLLGRQMSWNHTMRLSRSRGIIRIRGILFRVEAGRLGWHSESGGSSRDGGLQTKRRQIC